MQRGIAGLFLVVSILVVGVIVTITSFYLAKDYSQKSEINSFEDCIKDGNPIQESYPAGCNTKDGKHFVQQLPDEEKEKLKLPSESSESDDITENWKTFTNNEILFKYPSDWVISGIEITSSRPKIKMIVVSRDSTLMNECMQKTTEEIKNGFTIKKFSKVTTGEMCLTDDSSPREIWVVPTKDVYSPGFSYQYSAVESKQAEEFFP